MSVFVLSGALLLVMGALVSVLRSKPTLLHFADKPATLTVRKADGSNVAGSLKELVAAHCPSLFTTFRPVWWLRSGHLQTIYCVTGDFTKTDVLQYNRKLLRVVEGGTIGLDFAPADASKVPPEAPIIVVLHGLSGGSYESYVRSILVPACTPVEQGGLGYRAVVVNFRGCAGVPVTSGQMYSAGHTGDIRQALIYISHLYPRAPLLGLGFSLGANVLTRYLAEEGEHSRLASGCTLACPWDLAKNNYVLRYSFLGRFYSRAMGTNLIKLVQRHSNTLSQYPSLAEALQRLSNLKNALLDDFDENFTRIAGGSPPEFPFPDAQAYYKWASSHDVVDKIRVPFLAINSADDPVVQHVPDGGDNGFVVMALTAAGGHLGWFHAGPDGKTQRWITHPVLEWIWHPIYTEDGFLREEGKEGGCKEVEGGGLIEASAWNGVDVLQGL
ncbi:Alpha/Beta hydrolase protein [Mycena amicta]|nr:Alpha/Beta hydrolase protein [Mycena amicta]